MQIRNRPHVTCFQTVFSFCQQNSGLEKAFLFDVVCKIYLATDSSAVDMQSYELCCDMIDVVIDLSSIYGWVVDYIVCTFLQLNVFNTVDK
mgnify:CR=1 FL=1